MSEHTKGRLSVEYQGYAYGYDLDAEDGATLAEGLSEANARRVAACWNAFENVRTDLVELTVGSGAMQAAADAMEKLPSVQAELAGAQTRIDNMAPRLKHAETNSLRLATELTAARALLREALETFDDNPDEDHEIADRIRNYLDACDTLGDGNG